MTEHSPGGDLNGDDIIDFCIKCKRLFNHMIVGWKAGEAAKVRCLSCNSEHDFRRGQAPVPRQLPRRG